MVAGTAVGGVVAGSVVAGAVAEGTVVGGIEGVLSGCIAGWPGAVQLTRMLTHSQRRNPRNRGQKAHCIVLIVIGSLP